MEHNMQWIKSNIENDSDSRDLLLTTSRNLLFTVAALYTVWHFVATLVWPRIFGLSLWSVTITMGVVSTAAVYFIERRYVLAHVIWQTGLAAAIILSYSI